MADPATVKEIPAGVAIATGVTAEVTTKTVPGGTAPQTRYLPGLAMRMPKEEGKETGTCGENIEARAPRTIPVRMNASKRILTTG